MHDESLKYVLSDQAIVALAADAPTSERDIYDCILQADMSFDSLNVLSTVDSPSAVVCSHIEDLAYIFNNDAGKNEDIFNLILQKHLGPNGSCPLSVYNYTLLSKRSLKLTNQLVSKGNTYNHSKKVSRMASRELFVQKFSCKSPAYHNCRIYANDGRLLCYCDRRKLEWSVVTSLSLFFSLFLFFFLLSIVKCMILVGSECPIYSLTGCYLLQVSTSRSSKTC